MKAITILLGLLCIAGQSAADTQDAADSLYFGGKINLDGGSPGRTAYLREPYYTQDEGVPADYRGYSSITKQEDLDAMVDSFYQERIPIFIHALGDAAIDQAIHAVAAAQETYPREDIKQIQVLETIKEGETVWSHIQH